MAIKVLIKRRVPLEKARETITLFRQLRILATAQESGAVIWTQDSHFEGMKNVRYFPGRSR